jgi:peptidyl-prolyl cis-trans isomerase D
MIKLLREASHRYPWFLKSIMGLLAIAFVITMGWWGFSEQKGDAVASVGDLTVSTEEFQRAYRNFYQAYKDKAPGEWKDEAMKELVLDGLIENKLWLLIAQELGLSVSAEELRDDIMKRQEFHRNGKFDPDLYRRLLAANRLTPALFESLQTTELLREKAVTLLRDSVALTPKEIEEVRTGMTHQPTAATPEGVVASERLLQDFLLQKQQRALASYKDALKAKVAIKIHKELL